MEDHEEKEWLDALERGDLDDSGMLKKDKDPKLLTARQVCEFKLIITIINADDDENDNDDSDDVYFVKRYQL